MEKKGFLIIMLGLGISFSAQAEPPLLTLSQIEGIVLVNQGKQFARAHNGMPLREGDRVLTMKESQVALRSEEYNCASFLRENSLLTIPNSVDCETLTQPETTKQQYAALGDEVVESSPASSTGGGAAAGGATGGATTGGVTGGALGAGAMGATQSLIVGGLVVGVGAGLAAGVAETSKASPD
ncbi:hypothetical protein [Nitrosococcus wardiae]|uniref:Glycine zipper family protein n=1 Tax=Nitrosococcus wardiae TaxID=1814290 RepID=A0A4P7C0A4_9GAMM|nr:hypothetical protein [Nitrosococcus wardiae]QBQ55978.1 hypothetical protein E3U44_16765 [Nitrosococcus wardiae]